MRITVAEVLVEGNWEAERWSPRIADETAFEAFVLSLAARAAAYVEWRVGSTNYGAASEPLNTLLKEAEMHVCQEQLLLSAAEVADNASGSGDPVFMGNGGELRVQAQHRRARAEELLCPYDQHPSCCFARPAVRTGLGAERVAAVRFDEVLGRVPALC